MSLIGSLEDLGLGDILQIISLSQKSGALSIRGENGEGQIILRDGLVRGAFLKGGPEDLRGVLVGGQFLEGDEFDACCDVARREGTTIDEAIAARTSLTAERIDSLRRECVEAAVMAMFAWQTGEFSFDVSSDLDGDGAPLFLPHGINAQYLAMEGSRIEDESAHIRSEFHGEAHHGDDELPDEPPDMSAEEMFGVVDPADALAVGPGIGEPRPSEEEHDPNEDTFSTDDTHDAPVLDAASAVALATAERVDAEAPVLEADLAEEDGLDEDEAFAFAEPVTAAPAPAGAAATLEAVPEPEPVAAQAVAESVAPPVSETAPAAAVAPAGDARIPSAPLVVIDPDLVALEWIKQTLKDVFPRIHIFQRWDLGLNPIRQYLARATRPVVLLRPEAEGDPLSGIRNSHDFVARLKSQQPRLSILWLGESGSQPATRVEPADGTLTRPSSQQLRSSRAAAQLDDLAARLREDLAGVLSREVAGQAPAAAPTPAETSDSLQRLKQATRALAEASSRGEVLPLVIRFASEVFERVAMFMVRGDAVVGMAQHGLPAGGGPDDESLRQIQLSAQGSAWFRGVLQSRRPVRSGPSDGGDYTLSALLGNSAPAESYLAPIESSGEIVALLYGDNLPSRAPLGDSEALEVVLQHAGLALERAVLERALAEAEGPPVD
jgi:hypothetical protein